MSSEAPEAEALFTMAGHVSARLDADIYLFSGPVETNAVAQLMDSHAYAEQRTNCVLILTTYGGSPDAAFMLARFLKRKYAGKLILYIFGACKSAGTLVAVGADEIVMAPHGELGPLDIQLAKEDSLLDWNSGLDIFSALGALNTQAFSFFEHQFTQLLAGSGGGISTRTAADIATNLATQLLTPITAQIDPIRLGAMHRATEITRRYGALLQPSRAAVVEKLINGYPSHGFVIDFEEAQALLGCVREPEADERSLERTLRERLSTAHEVECIRTPHPVGIADCLTRAPATQLELVTNGNDDGATLVGAQPHGGAHDQAYPQGGGKDRARVQRDVRTFAVAAGPATGRPDR